jgi:DNA mismatch repair protein MutS
MALTQEYMRLTKQWQDERGENVMILYQNGSFFEIYGLRDSETGETIGSKIEEANRICDLKIAVKSFSVDGHKALQAGFKIEVVDKYVKKFYEAGYTIPIYEQEQLPDGSFIRKLSQVISPGTYWTNDVDVLSNNTTCIWLHHSKAFGKQPEKITIGISNLDIFTGKSTIFEFSNLYQHDPATYDELERFISVYKPSEVIIIHNINDSKVNDIIKFSNIQSKSLIKIDINVDNELSKSAIKCERQTYQSEIINSYFPNDNDEIFFENYSQYEIATQSFCFLLDFIQRHNPNLVNKISQPFFENCSDRLILANHSLSQLNIINDSRYDGKFASVCNFLNNCITNMGKRKFTHELLNPITNDIVLTNTYNITEHLLENKSWEFYRKSLSSIKDLEKLSRKLIIKRFVPRDISIIAHNINTVIAINQKLRKDETLTTFMSHDAIEDECNTILTMIEDKFDISKAEHVTEISNDGLMNYDINNLMFIKKGVSSNIDTTIKEYYDSKEKFECIRNYLSSLIQPFEKKSATETQYIKIHETSKSDDCLLGTKRRVAMLKTEIAKIVSKYPSGKINLEYVSSFSDEEETFTLDISSIDYKSNGSNDTNQIVTSYDIRQIASTIQNAKDKIVKEIIIFFNGFMETLIKHENKITNICNYIVKIDTLQNRCYIANKYNYCKPEIRKEDKSFIDFEGIRHCLIEHIQTRELYVTNDLTIGKDNTGYLIYGTNAVGKTSLIRSIGISLIMAQAGLYVPCSKFIYSPYKYLFTRILGNDNLFKGQSTFAVEMSELRTILNMANKDSLILGDELCSGTEQGSATSIFGAGLEFLDRIECSYIFATHFHEINSWPEINNIQKLKMMHMTVLFDKTTKQLLYDRKLKNGPGHNMYGLEVCKSLNLPDEFLNRAHELRIKYYPEQNSSNATSFTETHFNAKKIKGMCEICNENIGEEVHHLQHQSSVNGRNNYIGSFHKNHTANLVTVCEKCHNSFHSSTEKKEHRKVKTSSGYEVRVIVNGEMENIDNTTSVNETSVNETNRFSKYSRKQK